MIDPIDLMTPEEWDELIDEVAEIIAAGETEDEDTA